MDSFDKKKVLLNFIETYRSLPILWDRNHTDYNNREKKSEEYDKLLEILKQIEPSATKETVRRKIDSLRSSFRKEFRKVEDSKQSGQSYTSSLWYFHEFWFLIDQEITEENRSTLDTEQLTAVTEKEIEVNKGGNLTSTPIPVSKAKRKRNPSSIPRKKEDNEFLIMAKSYAGKLKKMDANQRLYADRVINEVLLEGQLGNLGRYSSVTVLNNFSERAPSTSSFQSSKMEMQNQNSGI